MSGALIRVSEAARITGLSTYLLYKMARQRKLTSHKIGNTIYLLSEEIASLIMRRVEDREWNQ